jgi:ribosomal protein L40E
MSDRLNYEKGKKRKEPQESVRTPQDRQNRQKRIHSSGVCPNCGQANPPEALFCEECGTPLGGIICPNCGAQVPPEGDICEACGTWILDGQCCFCSTTLPAGASFCPECGNPVGGIVCGNCGTLSFFDYCPQCHARLTEQAEEMVELLRKEPEIRKYLEAKQEYADIQRKYRELEQYDDGAGENPVEQDTNRTSDDSAVTAAIVSAAQKRKRKYKEPENFGSTSPQLKERTSYNKKSENLNNESEREERKKKLNQLKRRQEELKKQLSTPPPLPKGLTTNQEIRRYQMAIKPPSTRGWLCNAFHVIHEDPMHCTRPGDGGKWVT